MELPISGHIAPHEGRALTPEQKAEWDALIAGNDLVLFMKGTPDAPMCGFSARAAGVLQQLDRPFAHFNMFGVEDPGRAIAAIAEYAQFPTLPQIWVKGELIGGSDIALDMYESGELQAML